MAIFNNYGLVLDTINGMFNNQIILSITPINESRNDKYQYSRERYNGEKGIDFY